MAGSIWCKSVCLAFCVPQILLSSHCVALDVGYTCDRGAIGKVIHFDWILKDTICKTHYNVTLTQFPEFNNKSRLLQNCLKSGQTQSCDSAFANNGVNLSLPRGFRVPCTPRFAGYFVSEVTCGSESNISNSSLAVLDAPSKPNISIQRDNADYILTCKAESTSLPKSLRPPMNYSWSLALIGPDVIQPDCSYPNSALGQEIKISECALKQLNASLNVSCTVRDEGSKLYSQSFKIVNADLSTDENGSKKKKLIGTAVALCLLAVVCFGVIAWLLATRKKSNKNKGNATVIMHNNEVTLAISCMTIPDDVRGRQPLPQTPCSSNNQIQRSTGRGDVWMIQNTESNDVRSKNINGVETCEYSLATGLAGPDEQEVVPVYAPVQKSRICGNKESDEEDSIVYDNEHYAKYECE